MKIKHYLSKKQRKELENIINRYFVRQLHAMKLTRDKIEIQHCTTMKKVYIDYVIWCGFKVIFNPITCLYKITK